MKKIVPSLTIFSLIIGLSLSLIPPAQAQEDTLHLIMTVKWGNVQGEVTDWAESNFDGSISAASEDSKVSLIRTLLFETHTATADLITSNMDPVSWNSLIYGHWDGVRVLVSGPANDTITISLTPGSIVKTIQELYDAQELIIEDVSNGKEIVINTHPNATRAFVVALIWGKTSRQDYIDTQGCDVVQLRGESQSFPARCVPLSKEDFSGSLTLTDGEEMELIRTIRFEGDDQITNQSSSEISWDSYIWGGVDGLLVKFVLKRDVTPETTVSLSFPQQNYEGSISLLNLYHKRIIKVEVKPGYGFYALIWRHPNQRLIRAVNGYKVYMVEDGLKRHIPNPRVFEDQGLAWGDVQEVDDAEVEVLPEGDPLSYSEGTLIQGDGPEVYAISNDQKRHITNPQAFGNLQYNWGQIIKVDNTELALYSTGASITETSDYPDSTLVRVENQPTVYLVEGDKLKPITSPQAFASHNFRWDRVKTITSTVKNQYKVASPLELGDGALVRDPSGKVYVIDEGERRWIRTGEDLNQAGFQWGKIMDVTTQEINTVPEGEDIVSYDLTR